MSGRVLLVSVPEAARMLGISRSFVYVLITDGRLTPVRLGRAVRLRVVELERLIDELAGVSG